MARRKESKRYPVQRTISVGQSAPAALNAVADVGNLLSKVNHRLYRQSRYYECSVTIDANVVDGTTVDVYALADTWWTQKSLQLAKDAWDASNAEEKEMLNGRVARWNDFRVANGLTLSGGTGELKPIQFDSNIATGLFNAGEFDLAQVVDQTGATRTFTWANTAGASEYSIMQEYDNAGNTDSDPTIPAIGPYSGLLPNLEAGAAAALQDNGNLPPYNEAAYGNAIWVKVGTLHLAAGRQRLSTGHFTAPCGLIALVGIGAATAAEVQISVKSGDYKGVHAPSILE
jgi:hypothetical protein